MGVKYQVEQLQWNLDGSLDCFLCVCEVQRTSDRTLYRNFVEDTMKNKQNKKKKKIVVT